MNSHFGFSRRIEVRNLIGSDKVGHWDTCPNEIVKYYKLLDRLRPETAEKICRRNVLTLINGK